MRDVWRLVAAVGTALVLAGLVAGSAAAATTLPVLWEAGGLDAGSTGAGQAARIASDPAGNVAVVSGPAVFQDLAVTSYTPTGTLRWRSTVSPSIGVFIGDWVAAAANGDVLAVGHNVTSRGSPIGLTLVRFASDGRLQWRVDLVRTVPAAGRLLVDRAGNAYLELNAAGNPQAIELDKYSPAGALLWSRVVSAGVAKSLALSPDEADVVVTGNGAGSAWVTAAYDTATGNRRWLVTAAEGTTLGVGDVVVDSARVYVTGRGATGAGTPALTRWLTVVAYDRATGAQLWRTDRKAADATEAAGLRIDLAPDGSLVVAGQAARGFLDWYTVSLETTGAVRWEAVRDGGLNTNEIPAEVLVLRGRDDSRDGRRRPEPSGRVHPGRHRRIRAGRCAPLGGIRENGHRVGRGAPERRRLRDRRLRRARHLLARLGRRRQPAAGGGHLRHAHDRRCAVDRELRRLRVDRPGRNREVVGLVVRRRLRRDRERWPRTSTRRRGRTPRR